jgi:hypothetical protein
MIDYQKKYNIYKKKYKELKQRVRNMRENSISGPISPVFYGQPNPFLVRSPSPFSPVLVRSPSPFSPVLVRSPSPVLVRSPSPFSPVLVRSPSPPIFLGGPRIITAPIKYSVIALLPQDVIINLNRVVTELKTLWRSNILDHRFEPYITLSSGLRRTEPDPLIFGRDALLNNFTTKFNSTSLPIINISNIELFRSSDKIAVRISIDSYILSEMSNYVKDYIINNSEVDLFDNKLYITLLYLDPRKIDLRPEVESAIKLICDRTLRKYSLNTDIMIDSVQILSTFTNRRIRLL